MAPPLKKAPSSDGRCKYVRLQAIAVLKVQIQSLTQNINIGTFEPVNKCILLNCRVHFY